MKIRTQLLGLVVGASAMFLLSVAAYFVILSPLDTMEKEVAVFQELHRATAALQSEANQLLLNPFQAQRTAYEGAVDRFHKAIAGIKTVVVLPKASQTLADAVNAMTNLGALSETGLDSLTGQLDDLKTACEAAHQSYATTDWASLLRLAAANQIPNAPAVLLAAVNLGSQLTSLNGALSITRQVLEQKDGEIAQELARVKTVSTAIGLFIILVAVVLALILSVVLARTITRSLRTLGTTVSHVGAGDLRVRFASVRRDELGALGRDIDGFLDSLTDTFRRIQAASAENISVKDLLTRSVGSATASAVEIEANSSAILAQLQRADERIQSSEGELGAMVTLFDAFRRRLDSLGQNVTEANSTVAELTQGISEISALTDTNRQAGEVLVSETEKGREVFDRSFTKVAEISETVQAIQELVGAIAETASQTNILAMNAAIEAAHAGEAGKGFAVVSDEIAKLAAASAESSAQISATIKTVVDKILEASATREETVRAFEAMAVQIAAVSQGGRGIHAQTAKMNEGATRIRKTMDLLAAGATQTTAEAQHISSVAEGLGEALGQVGRISHEVVSNIGEITLGLAEISRTVGEVHDQSERLARTGSELDAVVNAFKTEETAEA